MRRKLAIAIVKCRYYLQKFSLPIGCSGPSSGKKVRENLARSVGEGLNTGQDAVEPMMKRLEKEFSELRKTVEDRLKQS